MTAARDPATTRRLKRRVADSMLLIASYQLFVHRQVFAPLLGGPTRRCARGSMK